MALIRVIHKGGPSEETLADSAHQPQADALTHSACKRLPELFKLVLFLPTSRPFVVVLFFFFLSSSSSLPFPHDSSSLFFCFYNAPYAPPGSTPRHCRFLPVFCVNFPHGLAFLSTLHFTLVLSLFYTPLFLIPLSSHLIVLCTSTPTTSVL